MTANASSNETTVRVPVIRQFYALTKPRVVQLIVFFDNAVKCRRRSRHQPDTQTCNGRQPQIGQ